MIIVMLCARRSRASTKKTSTLQSTAMKLKSAPKSKTRNQVKEGEKVLRAERYYGKVYRAFTLDQEIDEQATEAKYADGILELKLSKKAPVAAKRITIQ